MSQKVDKKVSNLGKFARSLTVTQISVAHGLSIADLPLENTIPESFRIGIVQVSRVLVSQICP